jgi:hypothetical protein
MLLYLILKLSNITLILNSFYTPCTINLPNGAQKETNILINIEYIYIGLAVNVSELIKGISYIFSINIGSGVHDNPSNTLNDIFFYGHIKN